MVPEPWPILGGWRSGRNPTAFAPSDIAYVLRDFRRPLHIVRSAIDGAIGVGTDGELMPSSSSDLFLLATLPPLYPEWLGDRSFCENHNVRFAYISGSMANGIATPTLVVSMAKAQMLGFFGAAGLSYQGVERGLADIIKGLGGGKDSTWGANLIHSPGDPALEMSLAELYISHDVRKVEASAFMRLTPAIVHYALSGLTTDPAGQIVRNHSVFAKVSRPEVARQFMMPAPNAVVAELVALGKLTTREAELGQHVAVAEDITIEADSGGHTDNRPLGVLFPEVAALRDQVAAECDLARPVRVGAAGGLGTPRSVAAAFAMGADYVLTGSINQTCAESGLSRSGRRLLADAKMSDVAMAPAADMFELGVNLQVLQRGTMFAQRARKLYQMYLANPGLNAIVGEPRRELEKIFGMEIGRVWGETQEFWRHRDVSVLDRAARDPKFEMALVFRWYLGRSSRWAINGDSDRTIDYQIWCGPALGGFNSWVADTYLANWEHRRVVDVALNLLEGAAQVTRAQQARSHGVPVPSAAFRYTPRQLC
nr:PfaD family polyunsaturated fatty acid/polyketide biosynthesis protein [Mycobacterium simiae]